MELDCIDPLCRMLEDEISIHELRVELDILK